MAQEQVTELLYGAHNFLLEIENDADAVAKKATASASKIKENAVTEADEKVEVARLQGLKLCGNQNFTARSC